LRSHTKSHDVLPAHFFDVQARASQLPPQRDLLLTMHPFTAYGKSALGRGQGMA
jgi:hypothetical protein